MTDWLNRTHQGDCRDLMRRMIADGVKVQCVVSSPPYWGLRDYGVPGQLGLERTWLRHVAAMRGVFRLVRSVLREDGVLWLNYGDSYFTPRVSGGVGHNSTINGKESQLAFMDAARARNSRTQQSNLASSQPMSANRRYDAGAGLKPKDMVGMPWRIAFALQEDGWWLRSDCIWHKPNPMPESITDRPTKSHEYVFLLAKSERYFYDQEAVKESSSAKTHDRRPKGGPPVSGHAHGPGSHSALDHAKSAKDAGRTDQGLRDSTKFGRGKGWRKLAEAGSGTKNNGSFDEAMAVMPPDRNLRTVWKMPTEPFSGAHFATFPRELAARCILAGSRPGDVVFDPFMGSGTVGQVATDLGRQYIGCELSEEYIKLHELRRTTIGMPF